MSYVSENLRPGEKLILEARLTPLSFVFSFLWSWILLFIPTLLLYLRYKRTELGVTERRVIEKSGILSVTTAETSLDKVQNVTFRQPVLGRIFNYGTVVIQSAATMGAEGIRGVSSPKRVRDTILQQIEVYRASLIREQAEAIARSIQQRSPGT
jgi:membrane protein YdbS with pleckstrin-like domain